MPKKIIASVIILFLLGFIDLTKTSASELKEVSADSLVKLIEQGKPVDIEGAHITGNIDARDMQLDKKDTEDGVTRKLIVSKVSLKNTTISDTVFFSEVLFTNSVSFTNVKFETKPVFAGACFQKPVVLSNNVSFEQGVNFKYACFESVVNFYEVQFGKSALFENSSFYSITRFITCNFNDLALFSRAKFQAMTIFKVTFNRKADFASADFLRVNFFGSVFEDSIDFSNIISQTMQIEWKQIQRNLMYNPSAYFMLIKNFKDQGQFEDADDAYYEYRVRKRQETAVLLYNPVDLSEYILDLFLWGACGYGTKPFRVIIFSPVLILFFQQYIGGRGV